MCIGLCVFVFGWFSLCLSSLPFPSAPIARRSSAFPMYGAIESESPSTDAELKKCGALSAASTQLPSLHPPRKSDEEKKTLRKVLEEWSLGDYAENFERQGFTNVDELQAIEVGRRGEERGERLWWG